MCVCVYMYVEGRELFTGRWRRGAVNSTVKKLGRRRTRNVVSKAQLFWKPAFVQRVHVAGDFILNTPWFDLVAWLPEVLGFYLAGSIWVRGIVK